MAGLEAILEIIQVLALALIAAGTIVLGALVAPLIFRQLSKIEAGIAVTEIFEKFSQWMEIAALALFTSKLIELVFIRKFNFVKDFFFVNQTKIASNFDAAYLFSVILVIAIFAISLYISLELMPKMISAFEDNEKEFKSLHKTSEKLMKINSVLAIIALVL
jgi:uncharacterized membrane protein